MCLSRFRRLEHSVLNLWGHQRVPAASPYSIQPITRAAEDSPETIIRMDELFSAAWLNIFSWMDLLFPGCPATITEGENASFKKLKMAQGSSILFCLWKANILFLNFLFGHSGVGAWGRGSIYF